MKTSTRLSRQFTLLSTALLLLFAIVINGLFFSSRYREDRNSLRDFPPHMRQRDGGRRTMPFERIKRFSRAEFERIDTSATIINNIFQYGDHERLMVLQENHQTIIASDVTPSVRRQLSLIRLSLLLVLIGAAISRLVSRRFARRSLRDVYTVADRTQSIDIGTLDQTLHLDHLPEDDEIRTIADSLDTMTTKLHDQVGQIKRFVSNLSHEIKTPLMASRTHAELALKTGNHEQWLQTTTTEIDQLHRLVDVLTTLHQADHVQLDHQPITIEPLVATIHEQVDMQHKKDIHYQQAISDGLAIDGDRGAREIILRNLLDNAYKYTSEWGYVTLTADQSHIAIYNTGSSLTDEQLAHIREPLRQADNSKGQDQWFWLGLTLVQTLVEKMEYTIEVVSDESGVRFEIQIP